LGASVIAVASTSEKRDLARRFGAKSCIPGSVDGLREQVKEYTRGRGADVIYDPVGGPSLDPLVRCAAFEGRIVVIGFASGQIPQVSAGLILIKGCSVIGSTLSFTQQHRPAVLQVARDKLAGWHAEGRLPSLVTQVMAFEQAPQALAQIAGRTAVGRIVLKRNGKADTDV
jgi:NADPH2:quinone reductase